jgi:hypothetical protein
MQIKAEYKLLEPFTLGFDSDSPYTTTYGDRPFTTDHERPGGYKFDSVPASTTLAFNWDNLLASIRTVRTTHKDGRGIPLNYFRGKIYLLHGELIAKDVYETLQSHTRPNTANRDHNYLVDKCNIIPMPTNFIEDYRWILIDEYNFLMLGERLPAQIFTNDVFDNDTHEVKARALWQNAVFEALGLYGSEGSAS